MVSGGIRASTPMPRLAEWLESKSGMAPELQATLQCVAAGAVKLARRISTGGLIEPLGSELGENTGGDTQKALDVLADDWFMAALRPSPVRWYASEEQDEVVELNPGGTIALAIDPLDGSSNIDVNVSIGTIFSIFEAKAGADESFLRPGYEQVAAGYVVYGPQTSFVLTSGHGVQIFVLDHQVGDFRKLPAEPQIPTLNKEYAINASNRRHWDKAVRAYINDCDLGTEGPLGRDANMRWVASLVAETHRILMRGGIFLYPGDARKGYARGRLRMVYECAPIAFIVEQAGGRATNGTDRLLDQVPDALHARTPFVFGSSENVMRVASYYDLPDHEISPLFGKRGLFSG